MGKQIIETNSFESETTSRYNEIAREYDSDWRGKHDNPQLKYLGSFEKMIGPPPKRILDAGCGTGKDSVYFASYGYSVWGIDLSVGMLNRAREKARNGKQKVDFSIQNMGKLDFPNSYFDGLWNVASLVHLSPTDKQKAIQEFYRILKPGGFLYLSAHNYLFPKRLMRFLQSYFFARVGKSPDIRSLKERIRLGYAYLDGRHWFYPTKHSLVELLKKEGFSILEASFIFSKRISIYAKK